MNIINVYLLFVIVILIIIISYKYLNISVSSIEYFDINIDDEISNKTLKELEIILKKYEYLDIPIIINNNGEICNNWKNNNKFKNEYENVCIINDNERKCLDNIGSLTSCNNYYINENGLLEKLNKLDISNLLEKFKYNVNNNINSFNNDLSNKKEIISKTLNDLISKKKLEKQQNYFIKFNVNNLQEKKNNINKSTYDIKNKENKLNIDSTNFKQMLNNNNKIIINNEYYKKIIYIFLIILIIIGLINLIISKIL